MSGGNPPLLEVTNLDVVYSDVILAVSGVSLRVPERGVVALLGANGAGKSTTLKAISGLLAADDGRVDHGTITFAGEEIQGRDPVSIFARGIVHVLEGRSVFEHLTVYQNLLLGAHRRRDRAQVRDDLERVLTYFPRLKGLLHRTAGYLSGGEQQMVVIGRALMARPRLMLLDEPSLGLAPQVTVQIFDALASLRDREGLAMLIVEQNARLVLEIADYGYVMENGKIVLEGTSKQLRENEDIKEFYLGLSVSGGRKGYKHAKYYKRRKRWLG